MKKLALLIVVGPLLAGPVVAVSVAPSASAAPARSAPGAVPPSDINTPVSGLLPICPSNIFSFGGDYTVFSNDFHLNGYLDIGTNVETGLDSNCADQDWNEDGATSTISQAVNASASPSTVSVSDHATTVRFSVTGADDPGPFNSGLNDCFPAASFAGSCPEDQSYVYSVAYRLADGSGQFSGPWTLAGSENNPWFDMTRSPGCSDNNPTWTPGHFSSRGFPCSYVVRFATDQNGVAALTTPMQVIVGFDLDSGTQSGEVDGQPYISPKYTTDIAVPLLFTTGGSTSLSLRSSKTSITYGKTAGLTAHAVGPAVGTPVTFYDKPAGSTTWSSVGTSATNSADDAAIDVSPKRTTDYRAGLATSGAGAPVQSGQVSITVSRHLTLAGAVHHAHVTFTGHISPAAKAALQRRVRGRWHTIVTLRPSPHGTVRQSERLPHGTSHWRLRSKPSTAYAASESRTVSIH